MKNILITGHPRSATHHISNLINAMGHSCTYEKRNPAGFTASWKHIKSGTFEPPCSESDIVCDFDKIIHQVRHPLKVIASATTLWTMSMGYMGQFIRLPDPVVNKDNTILNCMVSWFFWNKIIEKKATWRYQIEQLYDIQKEWCEQLEIPYQEIPGCQRFTNAREHIKLTWDDLFLIDYYRATCIYTMAQRYGYEK